MIYLKIVMYNNQNYTVVCGGSMTDSAKQAKNLEILNSFRQLKNNWNDYGAAPIDSAVLDFAEKLIYALRVQPEVFPTACNTVQLEYHLQNGGYLELEVSDSAISVFKIVSGVESEFILHTEIEVCQEVEAVCANG